MREGPLQCVWPSRARGLPPHPPRPSSETGHVEVIVRRSEQLQTQGEDAEATPKPALEALEQCRFCFPGMHSQRRNFLNSPRPRPSKARLQGYLRC